MTGDLHWFTAGFLTCLAAQFITAGLFGWATLGAIGAVICVAGAGLLHRRRP